jgi:hypothetical protein
MPRRARLLNAKRRQDKLVELVEGAAQDYSRGRDLMSDLQSIEEELVRFARNEQRRWQDVASLIVRVERERLWVAHTVSFTAWIQSVARRADLQESVFWRVLKAAKIYRELTGEEPHPELAISAESLELADKIRRHAPKAITHRVIEQTLGGELSRTELREVWATYRPAAGGATARGRLPTDPERREETLQARAATWEAQKRKPENRAQVKRSELIAAFRSGDWLGDVDQLRAEARLSEIYPALAAALVVRRKGAGDRLEVHGLWTCVALSDLADFVFAGVPGMDFLWLGVPFELADDAAAKAPRMAGVLALTRDRGMRTQRDALRRPITAEGRTALLTTLLQRAYLWP